MFDWEVGRHMNSDRSARTFGLVIVWSQYCYQKHSVAMKSVMHDEGENGRNRRMKCKHMKYCIVLKI